MKTVVFSDSHLNLPFDEKKYRFIEAIVKDADKVIINGDFWEGLRISFDQFIDSPYKHLFPILKSKDTVYIYGNHDEEEFSDKRTTLFANHTSESYSFQVNGSRLVFKHGDQYAFVIGKTKSKPPLKGHRKVISNVINATEKVIIRKMGKKALRQVLGRYNSIIKNKVKKELNANDIFVCGHTHLAEFNLKEKFINTGLIKHGLGQYMVIEGTVLKPVEVWYD